jgi:hypothetical protein
MGNALSNDLTEDGATHFRHGNVINHDTQRSIATTLPSTSLSPPPSSGSATVSQPLPIPGKTEPLITSERRVNAVQFGSPLMGTPTGDSLGNRILSGKLL